MAGTKPLASTRSIINIEDRLAVLEKYNIYKSIADLRKAKAGDLPYTLLTAEGRIEYSYLSGNYTGQVDNNSVIALDAVSITVGALVRQDSSAISSSIKTAGAIRQSLERSTNRTFITPEQFGATGYATQAEAEASTVDSTTAIRSFYKAMQVLGVSGTGNGLWYRCGQATLESNTFLKNINFFVTPSAVDATPFYIFNKNNIILEDCRVHGNRVNQTNLTTSGGDGQRNGFSVFGRCDNIRLIRPVAEYCATEGIHCWIGGEEPKHAKDYLQTRIYIEEPLCRWNGRHGISTASQKNFRIRGGAAHDNGKDIDGFVGPYTSGGNARKFNNRPYGRGLTAESYLPGEGHDGWEVDGFDGRYNSGGLLIFHRYGPGMEPCRRTVIRNCHFDDTLGGNGDGSLILYATDYSTNSAYVGSDAFIGLSVLNCTFGRNYLNINSAKQIFIEGGSAIVTASNYSVIFTNCLEVYKCNIASNKPVLGRPSFVTMGEPVLPQGWTILSKMMSVPTDSAGGRFKYLLAIYVDPSTTGSTLIRLPFTPGYVVTPGSFSAIDDNGTPRTGNIAVRTSSNGLNEIDMFITAIDQGNMSIILALEVEPVP